MNKQEFLAQLHKGLSGLPQDDIEKCLTFYSEMIEDQIEEGASEEEAVSAIGSVDEIVMQVTADIPLTKIAMERIRSERQLDGLKIKWILLILGSPIWLSLGFAAFTLVLSLYAVIWSLLASVWAIFAGLAACSVGGVLACVIFAAGGNGASGAAMLAAGFVCTGLSIFMFYGCRAASKGILMLSKKFAVWIKSFFVYCFVKKEDAA